MSERNWLEKTLGCSIMDGPFMMSFDVVGGDPDRIEQHRTVGILFRYFATHRARLADFQARLDGFARRSTILARRP